MSGYIGSVPVPQATQNRQDFVATASQTVFNTLGYEPKYVDVYLNGAKLIDVTDFTATNGTDIVLTSAASAGDTLSYLSFTNFSIVDSVGDLSISGTLTAEGDLNVDGAFTSQGIDDNATSTVVTLTNTGEMLVSGETTVTGTINANSFNDVLTTDDTVAGGEAVGIAHTLPTDRVFAYNGLHIGSRAVIESASAAFSAIDPVFFTSNGYLTATGVKTQVDGPIARMSIDNGSFRFENYHSENGKTTPSAGDVISAAGLDLIVEIGNNGHLIANRLTSLGELTAVDDCWFQSAIKEGINILTGTSVGLDPTNGTIQTHTLTGNTTYSETFGNGESMTLMIASTTFTVTWPTINWVNNDTLPPELGTTGSTVVSLWRVGGILYGAFVGNSEA